MLRTISEIFVELLSKTCLKYFVSLSDGTSQEYNKNNIKNFVKDPNFDPTEKLVIYIYAVLPESTSMFTKYQVHLENDIIPAYANVVDNFLLVNVDTIIKDYGMVINL